jgi:dipeptidyl aminopeptidase/acylaminoacyl peptidase
VVDIETGELEPILITRDADEYQVDFDPTDADVKRAVFTRHSNDGSPTQIHLLDRQTGETTPVRADFFYNFAPDWSPDGSRLIYLTSDYSTLVNMITIAPDYVHEDAAPQTLLSDQAMRFTFAHWISAQEILVASGGFAGTPTRFSILTLSDVENAAPIVEPLGCTPPDAVYFSIRP